MTTYCIILAWEISWTEEPSRLQSMGSQRVGHECVRLSNNNSAPQPCPLQQTGEPLEIYTIPTSKLKYLHLPFLPYHEINMS